jgi:uncharacterized protein (DUF433 family)
MPEEIRLIDRGRGLQLSTSRVTVLDLVPYFQQGCAPEEILRWLPTLTPAEIAVAQAYYRQHQQELDEHDRRVREHRQQQVELQRQRFPEPEGTPEERTARLKRLLQEYTQGHNGARNPG